MQMTDFLSLLGGLALFLYGMQMMSSGLEAAAGSRMKQILERLTANRFLGVLVGAAITAVIQSSSATTVMVVGFVNAGMMTLNQAVWIIMGANIGTTVTGLLIALDVGELAPLIAFVGVVLAVFVKKPQLQHVGQIFAGLGVLFIGMDMMSAAMSPLRESEAFVGIMSNFSNPVLGILAGMIFTAIIQSSSASVGILQALANSGVIAYANSVFVLFGQNIGTCITAVLASIGTTRNAKRTTIIHLMFNIIGTVIFTALFILFPIASVIDGSLVLPGALGSFLSGVLPATPRRPDRHYPHQLQHHHHPAPPAPGQLPGQGRREDSARPPRGQGRAHAPGVPHPHPDGQQGERPGRVRHPGGPAPARAPPDDAHGPGERGGQLPLGAGPE